MNQLGSLGDLFKHILDRVSEDVEKIAQDVKINKENPLMRHLCYSKIYSKIYLKYVSLDERSVESKCAERFLGVLTKVCRHNDARFIPWTSKIFKRKENVT